VVLDRLQPLLPQELLLWQVRSSLTVLDLNHGLVLALVLVLVAVEIAQTRTIAEAHPQDVVVEKTVISEARVLPTTHGMVWLL